MLRVGLLRVGGRPDRIAVIAHRLVADGESMRILFDDLSTALAQLRADQPVELPPKTTSWQSWVRRLVGYGRSDTVRSQRAYWTDLVTAPAGCLPSDDSAPADADTVATERSVTTSLDGAETDELLRLPDALNCAIQDVLLAALGRTLSSWTGHDRHVIDLVRHDREQIFDEVDLARTVGPFGRTHPVALACPAGSPPDAAVRAVKEDLRAVPSGGIGWQLLRQDTDPVPEAPVDLAFTYLAAERCPDSSIFAVVGSLGSEQSPFNRRPYPVEACASVAGGELTVRWTYSEARHRHETIARVAERYANELRTMIELGRGPGGLTRTPSDFPLARVDQEQLDELLSGL